MTDTSTAWVHHLGGRIGYQETSLYRTRVLQAGEGDRPPLLFLHGIGGHAEAFIKNIRPLADEFQDRTVMAIDFIGHGFSSTPTDITYRLSDYFEQVIDLLAHIGVQRAHVYGESLGGAVAVHLGLESPQRVASLGLITPAGLHTLEESTALAQKDSSEGLTNLFDRTMEMLDSGVTRETVWNRLDWLFVDDPDEELVDIRHRIYQRQQIQDVMPILYQTALVDGYDYYSTDDLAALDLPTLLVHTEHNPSSTKEQAEVAHDHLPRSEYHLFDRSAHWPQYEEPVAFNNLVAGFVRLNED